VSADDFRRQLARLVRELLEESHRSGEGEPVAPLLRAHLGEDAGRLPILTEQLDDWELPNLQLGLKAALAQPGWSARTFGLTGQAKRFQGFSLSDLISGEGWVPNVGPPEYVNAPVGPNEVLACLDLAVLLVTTPDGPVAVFVRRGEDHGPMMPSRVAVQAVAPGEGMAARFLATLRRLMDEHDVYRGKVLTVKADPHGGREIAFMERPTLDREDVVLPDGTLDRIERHVSGPTKHRQALLAGGRHLSRGLLLWGPPGTGKTLTVRYLLGQLDEATVVILSGGTLGMVGAFAGLAKRLAPSVVVLEDVDLVAQERTFGPFGSSPVLFELMNEMDGIGEDADVAWVLTTNRPDALEPALASRPGRIDLAVELPLPDDDARRRLLALYARGLDLQLADQDAVVARTSGVPASFVKELLRKAALAAAEHGRTTVTDDDVSEVLDELLAETSALTRVLLGAEAPSRGAAPHPHDWLGGMVVDVDETN
jgi:ATPase family protein associated with various cellular activities (AAA)